MVAAHAGGISLTELSADLDLNISTCHHLVSTLLSKNYLDQDPGSKRYHLGPKLLQLKNIAIEQSDVYARALPILQELNRETTETVHLAVLRNDKLVTVAKLNSTNSVRVDRGMIGESEALHCTATGKAILAFLPESDQERLLRKPGLRRYTARTITDPTVLGQELEKVRAQRYAMDLEEFEPGICCVGAPIQDYSGAVVASFSVSLPVFRAEFTFMQQLVQTVLGASDQISRRLGYLP